MNTSKEVFGRINRLPGALAQAKPNALRAAGARAKPVMEHSPGAPSRVAGKAVYVTSRLVDDSTLSMKWGPPGPVRIRDRDTQGHFIAGRGGRGKKALGSLRHQNLEDALLRGQGKASVRASTFMGRALTGQTLGTGLVRRPINIKGVGYRAYAFHPGTKGNNFVRKSKEAARPVLVKTYAQKSVTEPMRQVLHG